MLDACLRSQVQPMNTELHGRDTLGWGRADQEVDAGAEGRYRAIAALVEASRAAAGAG